MADKNKLKVTSKKAAIIISYLMVLMNTISNLVLTPLYLKYLGLEQYGLYQMIYAIAHYILILDFGVGTTMVRYISTYHAKGDYETEKNFSAHCLGIVIFIDVLIVIAGLIINKYLLKIYPTITVNEAPLAHTIFMIMIVTIVLTIIERFAQGTIMAYENFVIVRAIALIKVISKLGLTLILLVAHIGLTAIVLSDLIVTVLSIIAMVYYSISKLNFKIKYSNFDKALMGSILTFMLAIFLQSVVQYVNNTVDKTILGIMTTKTDVAIYSVAMTFLTLFNALPSEISSVFLPQAAKIVQTNETRDTLTRFVARPGRYQFMICGAIIVGFILFGKEFITLWAGEDTINAWNVALIIMIPNMIPLIENNVISVLDAKKKRLFRSVVLVGISIVNIAVSVVLVKQYGMIGAPIGTAFAYFVGYGIIMNVYYNNTIGINVVSMFKTIVSKVWLCIIIAGLSSGSLNLVFTSYRWPTFLLKLMAFCMVYFISLYIYGFNDEEKNDLGQIIKKIKLHL